MAVVATAAALPAAPSLGPAPGAMPRITPKALIEQAAQAATGQLLPAALRMPDTPPPATPCPCADASLCPTPLARHDAEFFGFGGSRWRDFDWGLVTTVAWARGDPEIICAAHKSGARIIAGAPRLVFSSDKAERRLWIDKLIATMRNGLYDGVTFDYEEPLDMSAGSATRGKLANYVSLVNETTAALRDAKTGILGATTSVCVPWSPDNIDGRNYDFKALADSSDMLYVMVYDVRSQILDRCIASANSPVGYAERGLQRYLQLGVPPDKLVMGTPWYGYIYPCTNTGAEDDVCQTALAPFRGVNCSDAVGREVPFMHIMNLFDRNVCPMGFADLSCKVTTPMRRDASTRSPYFNFVAGQQLWQAWFDDPISSAAKYAVARNMGLRGVGPYTWDDLDATGSVTGNPGAANQSRDMWRALKTFATLQREVI